MKEMYDDIGASVLGKRLENNVLKTDYLIEVCLDPPEIEAKTIWDLIKIKHWSVLGTQIEKEAKKIAYAIPLPVKTSIFIFPYNIRVQEALERVRSVYRRKLGTLAHLMTLGYCHPEIQKRLPIIVSGNDSIRYPYDPPGREESANWIFGLGHSASQGHLICRVDLKDLGHLAVVAEEG